MPKSAPPQCPPARPRPRLSPQTPQARVSQLQAREARAAEAAAAAAAQSAAAAALVERLRGARPILPEGVTSSEEQADDLRLICEWHEQSWAALGAASPATAAASAAASDADE